MAKEYLKETAKEYIDKFQDRVNGFLNEFEANEIDYINKELEYFEYTLLDVENCEASHDGNSITGHNNFNDAFKLCQKIGFEKFMYSTKAKINFLLKKNASLQQKETDLQNKKIKEESINDRYNSHQEGDDLHSLKYQIDVICHHLDFFYPLINTVSLAEIEYKGFELFKATILDFNSHYRLFTFSNISLDKTMKKAKLFLNEYEFNKFIQYAKGEFKIKLDHLYLLNNHTRELDKSSVVKIEAIFHENIDVGLSCFPTYSLEPNDNFLVDLRKGIESYFNNIMSTLNEIVSNEPLPPQPISVNENRTKKVIFETISNIDKLGWQYAFVSEQDYNLFIDLLTNFFEYKPYTLPETIIQLKRTCKTKVAKALGEIHKELSNENKLSTDTKYFQLIRVLSHFEKETEGGLYKALTR